MKTSEPDAKRPTWILWPQQVKLPDKIGKYIFCNAEEVTWLGWTEFVRQQRGGEILLLYWRWSTRRDAYYHSKDIATRRSC